MPVVRLLYPNWQVCSEITAVEIVKFYSIFNSMKECIQSIDMVRGLIMIIITLDHPYDFLHLAGPLP